MRRSLSLLAAALLALPGTAAAAPLAPSRATAFLDSIGVNVHLAYRDTAYGRHDVVASLIDGLGVRHVRDGVTADDPSACGFIRSLGARGIRFTFITNPALDRAALERWAACVGPALEAYEGPNEYDQSHPSSDRDWAATDRAAAATLASAVRDSPSLHGVARIAPSVTTGDAARALGDLHALVDNGNTHDYFGGHEPSTGGWGASGYGSIGWNLALARIVGGDRPVQATETGYSSGDDPNAVDARTQAVYLPELVLEHWRAGIPRTFIYQLLDEGGPPFAHYGLAAGDGSPKPAYRSLAGFLALLRAGAATRPTRDLPIDANLPPSVHAAVFARADGARVVALWPAVSRYDAAAHVRIDVPSRAVTIDVGSVPRGATIATFDDAGRWQRLRAGAQRRYTLTLRDRLLVLLLTP